MISSFFPVQSFFKCLSAFHLVFILIYLTGILIGAVVLGLAIVILLGILFYCLVKGKRKSSQHHRVPANNIPVTFEDRERLVYNSTTKPI